VETVLDKATCHIGVFYGESDVGAPLGKILLAYDGSAHDKVAAKFVQKIVDVLPAEVIVLLFEGASDADFQEGKEFVKKYEVVSIKGSGKVQAIQEVLRNNEGISLIVLGKIEAEPIPVLNELLQLKCPFLYVQSNLDVGIHRSASTAYEDHSLLGPSSEALDHPLESIEIDHLGPNPGNIN